MFDILITHIIIVIIIIFLVLHSFHFSDCFIFTLLCWPLYIILTARYI